MNNTELKEIYENMAEIPIMKSNFLRFPRYSTSVIRKQLLEKMVSVMFNFLIHVGRAEPAYATRFAAILLRTMLTYVSSDRFSRDNTVDDVSFFKVKMKNIFMHNVNLKLNLFIYTL